MWIAVEKLNQHSPIKNMIYWNIVSFWFIILQLDLIFSYLMFERSLNILI